LPASAGEESPGVVNPIGDPRTARRDASLGANDPSDNFPPIAGPAVRIGTLTVDQSGTGRLQQTVEGVQVQGIVGQALVIYSTNASSNRTLPPNLDATTDPGVPTANHGTQQGAATSEADVSRVPGTTNQRSRSAVVPSNGFGGQTPVVGGLIRLMSDPGAVPRSTTGGAPAPGATTDPQAQGVETPSVPAPSRVQP
jgi:hypothetical protein